MTERFRYEDFPENPSREQVSKILDRIRKRSFFASVLVDTFLAEVGPETIVVGYQEPYGRPFYAIGGRMEGHKDGYMRITGSSLLSEVKLIISKWSSKDKEKDREELFNENAWFGHNNRLYIGSNDQSHGGIETFGEKRQILIRSDLTISFAGERWPLAPLAISSPLDWWLLTKFLPRFLEGKVEPAASVPYEEMSLIVDVERNPFDDV